MVLAFPIYTYLGAKQVSKYQIGQIIILKIPSGKKSESIFMNARCILMLTMFNYIHLMGVQSTMKMHVF